MICLGDFLGGLSGVFGSVLIPSRNMPSVVLISNQMEGGEHNGEATVVESVASPAAAATPASAASPASDFASASFAKIITSSNSKGGDVAAVTEGGDDGEVMKGANGPGMTMAFPDESASGAAKMEKKALGDMGTTDVSAEEIIGCFCSWMCFFLFPKWYFHFYFLFSASIFCILWYIMVCHLYVVIFVSSISRVF